MDTNPLFFNPMQAGMATEIPETAIPRNDYTANIQDKRTELQRQQVMNGSAWKSGGYLYNQQNPKAVPVKHRSGLFMVYVDPPSEAPKEIIKTEEAAVQTKKPVRKLSEFERKALEAAHKRSAEQEGVS